MNTFVATCSAPVNIAVIKYWGKRNEELILPLNDSISSTLSLENMCAKTTVMASPSFTHNKLWLNGKEELFDDNIRLFNCLKEVKQRACVENPEILNWKVHVCSENNFPTAAGLASSAAGYACLVSALAKLYGVQGDISAIARRGSGSACRSVLGGWVQWHKGNLNDGADSIATQIAPATHWPDMRILILVVNDSKKKYSSTSGMKLSVVTSPFLKHRIETIVPYRVKQMTKAILKKDFETFAELTMKDSNQFHSVCLDTFPPCVYMNDISHAIVELVHVYNEFRGGNKVAYTFDAGPNACLYMLESEVPKIFGLINEIFPADVDKTKYVKGHAIDPTPLNEELEGCIVKLQKKEPGALKYVIYTKVGDGPIVLNNPSEHLLSEIGLPKSITSSGIQV